MNETLALLLRKCEILFFDDILFYSKNYSEHLVHVEQVLTLLSKHQWRVKRSKCEFAQRSIAYMGYVVSEQGVETDPIKVQAIQTCHVPTNVKELRFFLCGNLWLLP